MILIPQIYMRNGKIVTPDGTTATIFQEDPLETARTLKNAGADGVLCADLSITHMGASPNLGVMKRIHDELDIGVYVSGSFKTAAEIEAYFKAQVEMIVVGPIAYQKADFIEEVCKKFPGKIAVHIDVRAGNVTIPGYAVATNKTAFDYAEQFVAKGVRFILYSDVNAAGTMDDECMLSMKKFCENVNARVICTSEISGISDIEKITKMNLPRLEGLVLAKALYENRIDLKAAIAMVGDILLSLESDMTIPES